MSVEETVQQRNSTYGDFADNARTSQSMKQVMRSCGHWDELDPDIREALDMIAHKISRILRGNPMYSDSWHDIAGYALLVEKRLTLTNNSINNLNEVNGNV